MTKTKPLARIATLAVALAGLFAFTTDAALAQGQNGRGVGKQRVSISYYKVPPGKQDEWLALYKKYHKPIVEYGTRYSGGTSKIYVAGSHSRGVPWDFAIISIGPKPGEAVAKPKEKQLSRPELIRKLFPDLEDYVRGERARWALTIDHWDERYVELDPNEEPFSVYYPLVTKEAAGAAGSDE